MFHFPTEAAHSFFRNYTCYRKLWLNILRKLSYKTKISQRGFILAALYNEKTSDRSLYLRLLYYQKEIDHFFSKQRGINCNVNHSWLQRTVNPLYCQAVNLSHPMSVKNTSHLLASDHFQPGPAFVVQTGGHGYYYYAMTLEVDWLCDSKG